LGIDVGTCVQDVYYTSIFTIPVKQQLDDEWDVKLYYTVPIIDEAVDQWRKWLHTCKKAKGHPSI